MSTTAMKTNEQAAEHNGQQTDERKNGRKTGRTRRSYEWVPEVLALVIVTPALIHGIASLQNLPVV